ncbi:MAG: HD domain-containing protein, partial [Porticoccus sp.]
MVQVRSRHPLHDIGDICIDQWVTDLLAKVTEKSFSRETLVAACVLARDSESSANPVNDQVWATTVSSFRTGMEMAEILTELHLYDQDSLVASILYRAVREGRLSIETVRGQFGESVTKLIDSVQKMAVISTLRADGDDDVFGHAGTVQATKVREMLVAIIDDVRVALIKIAERTCAIRALKTASQEKRLRVAREIFDVYAPLSHRLGIGQLKWELEDLAFRYLETDEYMRIARLLDERRMDRQHYIKELISTLEMELTKAGIKGDIAGRAKHIYSIW